MYTLTRGVASLNPWLASVQPFGLRLSHAGGVLENSPE